tara:strand:- start:748 stop:903 length:156 start_codon:yes stop_codon:yes gene_type:complete
MTAFKNLISKIVVNTDDKLANPSLAKEILEWVKDVAPLVVVGKQKKGADKK